MPQWFIRWLERWDDQIYTIFGPNEVGAVVKYLTRYHIAQLFGFKIWIHQIHRSDSDRDLHTHPHTGLFILILKGGYWEHRRTGRYRRRPGQITVIGRSKLHLVELPEGRDSWSLVLTTPKFDHSWFFLMGRKLVPWIAYYRLKGYPIGHI